jgi:hypothetical protein
VACKFEDIVVPKAKFLSEQVAHGALSPKDINEGEIEILQLFDFQINFVTHFDFYETYLAKLQGKLAPIIKQKL